MKTVAVAGHGRVAFVEGPTPTPGPGEVLIKVHHATHNPTHWQHPLHYSTEGAIVGYNLSGQVEAVGHGVPSGLRFVGERVAAFIHGDFRGNEGVTEYVIADANLVIPIPAAWSFEDAARINVAHLTAGQCLYQSLELPVPSVAPVEAASNHLLVWGGASPVGQSIIQLARLSGVKIIATGAPQNFALLRSLGADLVFSHTDPETPVYVKAATAGKLKYVVDCTSEGVIAEKVALASAPESGVVSVVLDGNTLRRRDIQFSHSLGYVPLAKEFELPLSWWAHPESYTYGVRAYSFVSDLLARGTLRPAPIAFYPTGLVTVQEGPHFRRVVSKVHVGGEKLVYRMTDTPGLLSPPVLACKL